VERLLSSVLLCAGLGLTAAIAALGLDADSNEARIGLAHVLGAKLADEWSPVLQEDPRQAEQLLVEVLDRGDTTNQMAAAHFEL
jgi:hypothetical protein